MISPTLNSLFEIFVYFDVDRWHYRKRFKSHCRSRGSTQNVGFKDLYAHFEAKDGILSHEFHLVKQLRMQVVLNKEDLLADMNGILFTSQIAFLWSRYSYFEQFWRSDDVEAFGRVNCCYNHLRHVFLITFETFEFGLLAIGIFTVLFRLDYMAKSAILFQLCRKINLLVQFHQIHQLFLIF